MYRFARYWRDVRRRKTLGGKVIAMKGTNGRKGWEAAQEKYEQPRGSRARVGIQASSFDVISSFIARRGDCGWFKEYQASTWALALAITDQRHRAACVLAGIDE